MKSPWTPLARTSGSFNLASSTACLTLAYATRADLAPAIFRVAWRQATRQRGMLSLWRKHEKVDLNFSSGPSLRGRSPQIDGDGVLNFPKRTG